MFDENIETQIERLKAQNKIDLQQKADMVRRVWATIDASEDDSLVGDSSRFESATGVFDLAQKNIDVRNEEINRLRLGIFNTLPRTEEIEVPACNTALLSRIGAFAIGFTAPMSDRLDRNEATAGTNHPASCAGMDLQWFQQKALWYSPNRSKWTQNS